MKNIYVCFNYLTLYKAIYNIRKYNQTADNIIFYRSLVSGLPEGLNKDFNIIEFKMDRNEKKNILTKIKNELSINLFAKRISKRVISEVNSTDVHEVNLIVFKDNGKIDSTIIDEFKSQTKNKGKVILIEEGIGLYKTLPPPNSKKRNKIRSYLIQFFFKLSKYYLENNPQGYNPKVDEVICTDKKLFQYKKGRYKLKVVEQTNIFTKSEVKFFIEEVLRYEKFNYSKYKEMDLVYLTQPLYNLGITEKYEQKIIEKVVNSSNMKVLFKRHPRDKNLRSYKNIYEVEKQNMNIPFECLYSFMNYPIIITFYSSGYFNILKDNPNAKVILLYKLINNQTINDFMKDFMESMDEKRIFIPNNLQELEKILIKLKNNLDENF